MFVLCAEGEVAELGSIKPVLATREEGGKVGILLLSSYPEDPSSILARSSGKGAGMERECPHNDDSSPSHHTEKKERRKP